MTRDQVIGAAIFIVCLLILIGYLADVVIMAVTRMQYSWIASFLEMLGAKLPKPPWGPFWVLIWLIAVPVVIAFCAVMAIGAWIGWTMATTPPPAPIEELEEELRGEEEKKEEGKEEERKEGEEEK
ncbi:hypothetical protein B6U66_01315 [Candidatus Bathyarchaeota archaeon ex4484_135]|nr:MAG: hypothetical protein B6U66_01315 [Candidatus Bathyarchaeota archaeon ex4484_135]